MFVPSIVMLIDIGKIVLYWVHATIQVEYVTFHTENLTENNQHLKDKETNHTIDGGTDGMDGWRGID